MKGIIENAIEVLKALPWQYRTYENSELRRKTLSISSNVAAAAIEKKKFCNAEPSTIQSPSLFYHDVQLQEICDWLF